MSSLFANLNNPNNPPTSLFNTPSTTAQSGGLFGGLNTSKPATATGGGLFGGLGGSTATSQAQTGGGLFGASTQPQQQQTSEGSLFGGLGSNSQPQQQQAAGSNLLSGGTGAASQSQQQSGLAASTQNSLQQSQQNGQNNAYFDAILERSRKRAHAETIAEDLPQLQLGLGDLRQRIKRLGTGAQDRTVDGRAHYLLAASGVDPGAAVRDLNAFTSAAGRTERPPSQDANDTDVEAYLANLQTQTTLSMIADGLARSVRDFDAFLEDNVAMEWDAQRKKIYQHFGIRPRETIAEGRASFAASGAPSQGGFGRSRRSKTAAMASSQAVGIGRESTFGRSSLQKSVIGAAGPLGEGHRPLFTDVEKKMEANGIALTGTHNRFQREKQSKFAAKAQDLNAARLQNRPYPICQEFASVVSQASDQHGPDLIKAYRALMEIVGENPEVTSPSDPNALKARLFAGDYLDETLNSPKNKNLKTRILRGGARCLEKLAFERMEDLIAKNPRDANLGGVPNVVSKVKAYVRIQAIKKNLSQSGENGDLQMLGDDFVWALLYFLLRTGHVREAAEYVASNAIAFRAIDRSFASYIRDYATSQDRRLNSDLQARISSEYNQRLRIAPENSIDPYRMACYKIIGRCDLRQRSIDSIKQDVEDFTWLQLVLAREINPVDEIASEVYGLTELQGVIREIGSRFFEKGGAEVGSSFGVFVFLQVAVGMFEEAVSYLNPFSYIDSVHLAIALDFYGLLRVSDPSIGIDTLRSQTTRGQFQISFGMMIGYYTRDFRVANVSAAVDYLTLICLNQDLPGQGGKSQVALCHESLRELVLESREFALLLGDLRADGTRITGIIEERMQLMDINEADDFMRTITMQAASVADDNGRVTDAVLLYHLAGECDNVIVTISRALSEAIAVPIGQEQMRLEPLKPRAVPTADKDQGTDLSLASIDEPVALASKIAEIYGQNAMFRSKINDANLEAFETLRQMSEIKGLVERGFWPEALDVSFKFPEAPFCRNLMLIQMQAMGRLNILPIEARGQANAIRNAATRFSSLPQPIAQNVPTLLMWALDCCNKERAVLSNRRYGGNEGSMQLMIEKLKQTSMDLTTYTSQLRYRFPPQLLEALARAQSD
jgi:nuclear pore complex protein Nup93